LKHIYVIEFIISFGPIGCSPYTRSNLLSDCGAQKKAQGGIWWVCYILMEGVGLGAAILYNNFIVILLDNSFNACLLLYRNWTMDICPKSWRCCLHSCWLSSSSKKLKGKVNFSWGFFPSCFSLKNGIQI
jgi:hypothetical protein